MKSSGYGKNFYFAYGSNMNLARVRTRNMQFSHCESGVLSDFVLSFNKRSVKYPGAAAANVMPEMGKQIEGVVYHLTDESQILAMDPFEGYPIRYDRELLPIKTASGLLQVWVYIATADHVQEGLKPAIWYLNHLLAGRDYLTANYAEKLSTTACIPGTEVEPQP